MDTFDETYARYLEFLALLDSTDDISEKNLLFRQLTQLLSDMEQGVRNREIQADRDELVTDEWGPLLEPDRRSARQGAPVAPQRPAAPPSV